MNTTTTPTISCTPGTDPRTEVRTDLWGTMQLDELANQQRLLVQKLSNMASIIGPSSPPFYIMIYNQLQDALQHLDAHLHSAYQQK